MNREIIIKMQLIPPLRYQLHEPWFVDNSSSKFCVETITNGSRKPLLATEIRCYYYYFFFPRLAHGILCSLLLLTTAIRQKKKIALKCPQIYTWLLQITVHEIIISQTSDIQTLTEIAGVTQFPLLTFLASFFWKWNSGGNYWILRFVGRGNGGRAHACFPPLPPFKTTDKFLFIFLLIFY